MLMKRGGQQHRPFRGQTAVGYVAEACACRCILSLNAWAGNSGASSTERKYLSCVGRDAFEQSTAATPGDARRLEECRWP
jgi:hypothetical protein